MNSNLSESSFYSNYDNDVSASHDAGTTQQSVQSNAHSTTKIIDDIISFYLEILVYCFLCGIISIIGIGTNVTNIIIFNRQGIFTEGGSPSLLCLAVSDLCCLISMLWYSVSFAIFKADPEDLPWDSWDISYLTAAWPHLMFAQITRMVTAYVSFERCVCVVFPFKVKSIFTPKRSILVTTGIFTAFALSYSPVFIMQRLEFKFDANTNKTRLGLVFSPHWQLAVGIMYYVNSITFNIGAVAIVLVCTMVTVSRVNLSKAWRESIANQSSQQEEPNKMAKSKMQKEKKLVRMITSISVIFLICYIPDFCFMLMFTSNTDIRVFGTYHNLAMLMYSLTFLMETINSSINIIVYWKMSSRYKEDLYALFRIRTT